MNDSDAARYVTAVLNVYLGLPETPLRATTQDRRLASQLQERGVTLGVVESAFLLASVRRLVRPADVPPLSPIRSLAYFQPVIDELLSQPPPEGYLAYLRLKLEQLSKGKLKPKEQAITR
jgi:DNA-binding helix-hairpin-helix protein with protein kinase domain